MKLVLKKKSSPPLSLPHHYIKSLGVKQGLRMGGRGKGVITVGALDVLAYLIKRLPPPPPKSKSLDVLGVNDFKHMSYNVYKVAILNLQINWFVETP